MGKETEHNAKIISLYFQKGGIGKTSLAINLAAFFSTMNNEKKQKNRVLLIDFDSQAASSKYFDVFDKDSDSIFDVLKGTCDIKEIIKRKKYDYGSLGECTLDIVPSTEYMHEIEMAYFDFDYNDAQLAFCIQSIIHDYDFIFIDCPSQMDVIFRNAFNITDYFILGTDAEEVSADRIEHSLSMINELTTLNNPGKILGAVITKYNPNRVISIEDNIYSKDIVKIYEEYVDVFENKIPETRLVSNSYHCKMPIPFYYRKYKQYKEGYYAYRKLALEIMDKIDKDYSN